MHRPLLLPPLLWIGIVYLGSLFALLLQSFYSLDEFSGLVVHEFTLSTYGQLFTATNMTIILRTAVMAAVVTTTPTGNRSGTKVVRPHIHNYEITEFLRDSQ